MIVNFKEWFCTVKLSKYENYRTAIVLEDLFTKETVLVATVNLPEIELSDDEVFIKDWSENAGIYDVLVNAGLIERFNAWVNLGLINAYRCKIKGWE